MLNTVLGERPESIWDANVELASEFARTLLGENDGQRQILATGLDGFLAAQPDSDKIDELDWNLSEPETLEQGFVQLRCAGADALCTQTAHIAAHSLEQLAAQNSSTSNNGQQAEERLQATFDLVASRAHRAVQSAGPHFIVGSLGWCGVELPQLKATNTPPHAAEKNQALERAQRYAKALYRLQAQALVAAGAHALIISNMPDALQLELAVQAASQTQVAILVQLPWGLNSNAEIEPVLARLSQAGAHALVGRSTPATQLLDSARKLKQLAASHGLVAIPQVKASAHVQELNCAAGYLCQQGFGVVATDPHMSAHGVSALAAGFLWGQA